MRILSYLSIISSIYPKLIEVFKLDKDLFKDYVPEILVYDEAVDGSGEYKIRDEHLSTKENLLEKIRQAKAAAKGNKTVFRQNIRTENEEK